MFRILFFIITIAAVSYGLSLIADVEGKLIIQWPGGEIQPTLMQAVLVLTALVFLLVAVWTLVRMLLSSPEMLSSYFRRKKREKGLAALSGGMIALSGGDRSGALKLAAQARKTLPNDPMTLMLRAQAAELEGDAAKATHLYESMLASSDTEIMGLRGLYMLALAQNEPEAAEQYAARAVQRRQDLEWAVKGLFDLQAKSGKFTGALETLKISQVQRHIDGKKAKRYRAVLLTGLADELEDVKSDEALAHAREAIKLAPELVPAAVIAGRINASRGQMHEALGILRKCWKRAPHPDIALVSAYARPGDSVRDRLSRIQSLAGLTPGHREAALAVARAAIEAKDWALARESLGPLVRGKPSQQVCTLMARIEAAECGNKGLVREWLSRAVTAAADPQWVADGKVFEDWAPVSPLSGKLDAFRWEVPEVPEAEGQESLSLKQMITGLLAAETLERETSDALSGVDVADATLEGDADNLPVVVNEKRKVDDGAAEAANEAADEEEIADAEVSRAETQPEAAADAESEAEDAVLSVADEGPLTETQIEVQTEAETETKTLTETGEAAKAPAGEGKSEKEATDKTEIDGAADAAGKGEASGKRKRRARQRTKIFVSPPAPDDPGTELDESGSEPGFGNVRPVRY